MNPTRKYRPFLQLARDAGGNVGACLARARLSEAQFLDPYTRVPRSRAVALCETLVEVCGGDEAGLLAAERCQPGDLDVLGYLVKHSATPLAAMRQLVRYTRLVGDAARFEIELGARQVAIKGRLSGGRRMLPAMADYTVAVLFRCLREASDGAARPIAVELPRSRPRWANKHRRFFDAHVRYDSDWAALVYSTDSLQQPQRHSDPQLSAILERRADDVLSGMPGPSNTFEQIRACIGQSLEQREFAADAIANRLGMSERTLRRRLAQCGSSYRELLEDVRRERSLVLVCDDRLSVAALADRLGFDDPSAFARAFRRWTGLVPSAYLRAVRATARG